MMSKMRLKQTEIGEIPTDWRIVTIPDVACNFDNKRKPLSSAERSKIRGQYPYYGAAGIIDYVNDFRYEGNYLLIAEDGTVTSDGNRPMLQLTRGKFWVSNHAHVLQCKLYKDTLFLYYQLKNTSVAPFITGAVQPKLSQENLNKIKFPWIENDDERGAIAKILSDLDDKIELNHQTNKTLESIAQAIFKQWFVDFEFPGYEKTKIVDGLPEGWYKGCLADILEISIGGDWGNDNEAEGMVQAISLRGTDLESLKSGGYAPEAPVRWIRKDKLGKRIIRDSDILIGGSGLGPIGKTIYCSRYLNGLYAFPVTYSNFCKRLTAKTPGFAVYAERILENMYLSGEMDQFYTGTSIPNLDVNSLIKFPVIIPTAGIVSKFYEIVAHKFMKLFNKENTLLSQIRDSLLPRLMSGKIRVNA